MTRSSKKGQRIMPITLSIALAASLITPVMAQDATKKPQKSVGDYKVTNPLRSFALQDPPQTQQGNDLNIQQPTSEPIPRRTVGLDPGKVAKWTLHEAILAALDKNLEIEIQRSTVRMAQSDIVSAEGFYDLQTRSNINYGKSIRPYLLQYAGATTEDNQTSDQLNYNFGLSQNIQKSGGLFRVDFNNSRQTSNVSTFSLSYEPEIAFSISQPLFKNFKIDRNRQSIKIAKKQLDISDAQFRQRAITIISQVQQAYWDLALAIRSEDVARETVALAEVQLNNNKRQVEVGTMAPIDVVNAATNLETNRQSVFQRMNEVARAENALKALCVSSTGDDLWNSRIEPADSFEIAPVSIPLSNAIKTAQENRPEVKQLNLQKDVNQINVDFFANQAKPQIDLIGSYTMGGLGGNPQNPNQPNCSPLVVKDKYCYNLGIGTDAAGNFIPEVTKGQPFAISTSPYQGGYGKGLSSMFKNDFKTWSIGVQFNFPLRNRTAKANLAKEKESGKQIDLQTQQQLVNIEVEVRNAVQALESAKFRIEAAKKAEEYAKAQYEGEQKKFEAGMSNTFFILQRQNDLSNARLTALSAQGAYNIAVATLQRVMSTTLSSNNIEVNSQK